MTVIEGVYTVFVAKIPEYGRTASVYLSSPLKLTKVGLFKTVITKND